MALVLRGGAAVMWHGHKSEFPYFQGGALHALFLLTLRADAHAWLSVALCSGCDHAGLPDVHMTHQPERPHVNYFASPAMPLQHATAVAVVALCPHSPRARYEDS